MAPITIFSIVFFLTGKTKKYNIQLQVYRIPVKYSAEKLRAVAADIVLDAVGFALLAGELF